MGSGLSQSPFGSVPVGQGRVKMTKPNTWCLNRLSALSRSDRLVLVSSFGSSVSQSPFGSVPVGREIFGVFPTPVVSQSPFGSVPVGPRRMAMQEFMNSGLNRLSALSRSDVGM